jgi:radical SAM superfamily enzyme YgiQ (UPF0313 family)
VTPDTGELSRRHLSREEGTIHKDWGGRLPVALIYPNSYYLGMSNLGIHTIYNFLNNRPDIVCERIFWENPGGKTSQPPVSTESQRGLAEFAALAFSVTYELDYFNIPRILKAAGIPPLSEDRDESYPLIIAGGACITANPMPVSPFFDVLAVGEAEAIFPGLLSVLPGIMDSDRNDQLKTLAQQPGLYIPGLTQVPVARQWVKDLDNYPVHTAITTHDTELGDMYLIEVERGCPWRCRFCLVGGAFHPMRIHSIESILEQSKIGLKYRKRLGLVGPDVVDHPQIEELLERLKSLGAEISISSLRVKPLIPLAVSELARGGTGSVAFAPEAGSERLRKVIKKGITEDDILKAMEVTSEYDIKQLRLYFMIGLPSETDDDIDEIARLTTKCKTVIEKKDSAARITLSVSPFVPKAGTPFQWLPMESLPVLNRRLNRLKTMLRPTGVKVTGESPAWSEVQAILARGDRNLAGVLTDMDEISLSSWKETLHKAGIDPGIIHHKWSEETALPWRIIESGTSQEYLKNELDEALKGFLKMSS